MKSFTEAYAYIRNTSPENIAKRTAIIGAWFNNSLLENFGHDIILDIVAALYGPFDFNIREETLIFQYLDMIKYGFNTPWVDLSLTWAKNNASSPKEYQAFNDMLKLLFNEKADKILEHFNYICKVVQPSRMEYFPELYTFDEIPLYFKAWERI